MSSLTSSSFLSEPSLVASRQGLLDHPLWQAILSGKATKQQLRTFALQDYWLVGHSPSLESLLLEHAPEELRPLFHKKILTKEHAEHPLVSFGAAFGLSEQDFLNIEPLAGCAALTMNFYHAFHTGGFAALLASVSASESVFIELCSLAAPALQKHYGLNDEQVDFFSFHDELIPAVEAQQAYLSQLPEQAALQKTVTLTYRCEALFYDTVYEA